MENHGIWSFPNQPTWRWTWTDFHMKKPWCSSWMFHIRRAQSTSYQPVNYRCDPRRNNNTKQPSAVRVTEIEAKNYICISSFQTKNRLKRKESAPKSRQPSICFQIRLSLLNIATRGWSILIQWQPSSLQDDLWRKPRCSWCMIGYSLMAFPKSKKDGNNKQKHKGNLG